MQSPSALVDAFRASGRKITPQRELIFSILDDNPAHPTAEAIHASVVEVMPSVSLRTVYATLHELAELGEIRHLDVGTGSTRFDTNTVDHEHFVCTACGRVFDVHVDVPSATAIRFTVADPELADSRADDIKIVLRGRCARCAAAGAPRPDPGKHVHPDHHREKPING